MKNSGKLIRFQYFNRAFELTPITYFYDWLYINALSFYPELTEEVLKYNAFTDIVFNPEKSKNCQARSAAIYVSLYKTNKLSKALKSKEDFLSTVYYAGINFSNSQLSLFG